MKALETKSKKFFPKFFLILIFGVLIRLILMPITYHPDLLGHSFSAYFLAYEGKINLYDTLASLPPDHPLVKNFGVGDIFIYPPLTYYTLGLFRILVKPLADPKLIPWLMVNLGSLHSYPRLFEHLFLFKLPYLFFDVGLAFLLTEFFDDRKKKRLAFALWMFNPVAIYVSFMIGQLDLLPVFFSVLALYFYKKKKNYLSMISMGIAASYKMYPLFLILPLAFLISDKFKERVKLTFAGIFPFIFFIAPYLSSSAFRSMVFSPKSQKMLFMNWPLSGAEVVYPFVFFLSIITFFSYYQKRKFFPLPYFLAILLLIFSVTHFHPQWFLWVVPFLVLELVENNFENIILTLVIFFGWLSLTFLFEPSLSFGLFNPIWPNLDKAIGLSEVVNKYTNVYQFKSLIRSVFAGASFFLVFRLFSLKKE